MECDDIGDMLYQGRCYFVTSDKAAFDATTCSNIKAESRHAIIRSDELLEYLMQTIRSTGQRGILWTGDTYDPNINTDHRIIHHWDGTTTEISRSNWRLGNPTTTYFSDEYATWTRIGVNINRSKNLRYTGLYNENESRRSYSLCVY